MIELPASSCKQFKETQQVAPSGFIRGSAQKVIEDIWPTVADKLE